MADDFDTPVIEKEQVSRNEFNPSQRESENNPKPDAVMPIKAQTPSKRPEKRTKLPAELARCTDCFELRDAYKQLLEQEREMQKILRDKELQVQKQGQLLVKTSEPDSRGEAAREQIRVLEQEILSCEDRMDNISLPNASTERKNFHVEQRQEDASYTDFLRDTKKISLICQLIQLQNQNKQKLQYVAQLKENNEKKKSGKQNLRKLEIQNARNQIIACEEKIEELKIERKRNYEEIQEIQKQLVEDYQVDLQSLYRGEVYQYRELEMQSEKEAIIQDAEKLLSIERPKSPPGREVELIQDYARPPAGEEKQSEEKAQEVPQREESNEEADNEREPVANAQEQATEKEQNDLFSQVEEDLKMGATNDFDT